MINAALLAKALIIQTLEFLLNEKSFTGSPDPQFIFILVLNLGKKREKLNASHSHTHTHTHRCLKQAYEKNLECLGVFFFFKLQLNKNALVKVLDKQQLCQQDGATHFPGKPAWCDGQGTEGGQEAKVGCFMVSPAFSIQHTHNGLL